MSLLGNAMVLPVVGRVLLSGLKSVGIAVPEDPWTSGQAQEELRKASRARPLEECWRRPEAERREV
eukprot:2781639-Alexandrium_andersonii.AAC.1